MSDWPIVELADIADIRISNVDKKSVPGEQRVLLCNYMDVYANDYVTEDLLFMEATAPAVQVERFRIEVGDVMITKDSETPDDIGIPAVNIAKLDNFVCGYHLALLKPRKDIVHGTYLAKQLGSRETASYFGCRASGSTRYGLSNSTIARTPIRLAPLLEQQWIAEILSTVDEAIAQTEALVGKLQQMKAGLMHDLFTRGVTLDGHLRPTRQEAPHLYHETPIGWIPKEWKPVAIGNLADSVIDGPFGSNLKTEHYVIEPGVRVVRLQNVDETQYNDEDPVYVSDSHANFLLRNQVLPGDVLIAGLGEDNNVVGRACCYPAELPPAINKADCFRLRCQSTLAVNAFVMFFLNTDAARRQVRRFEQGVTRRRINTGNIKKLVVGVPSIPEQQLIIRRLIDAGSQIQASNTHLAKLRLQKQGLMQDLLSGKVSVKPVEPD